MKQAQIKLCPYCLKKYQSTNIHQKFCSPICRYNHWNKVNPRLKSQGSSEAPNTEFIIGSPDYKYNRS